MTSCYHRSMRTILTFGLLLALLLSLSSLGKPKEMAPVIEKESALPSPEPTLKSARLELGAEKLIVFWRRIEKGEQVSLIANFENKLSGSDALAANGCDFLVNGGFYTPDNQPLGLFRLEAKELGALSPSKLLNGFVWGDDGGVSLGNTLPEDATAKSFVLQSGPYISLGKAFPDLEEERARRALVAVNADREIFFLAILSDGNYFSGPKLNDLKVILESLSLSYFLKLTEAVNLDGGSTLAFLQSGEPSIPEVKKSGSFFCVKNRSRLPESDPPTPGV